VYHYFLIMSVNALVRYSNISILVKVIDPPLRNLCCIYGNYWVTNNVYGRLRSASELKSASTPEIGIHWRHYLKSLSDLRGILKSASEIHRYMSDYWLGLLNTSVTSLDVDLTKWETAIDLRIWLRFENLEKDIYLRIVRRFENLKKDIYLRLRCLWRRNRTWIGWLDVDLSLTLWSRLGLSTTTLHTQLYVRISISLTRGKTLYFHIISLKREI
jgi:hypothetical protein